MVILITYHYHMPMLVVVWTKVWFCGCFISAMVNSSPVVCCLGDVLCESFVELSLR
jgi:hypothetical protein